MENHKFSYKVRLDDLDYMGIVGNSQWMIFLERVRIDLLEKINFPFSEMKRQNIGGVVAQSNIRFLKPAFFDDKLEFTIRAHSPFTKGLILNYKVENQKGIECLTADITMVFVDMSGKAIKMPEFLSDKLFNNKI